MNCIIIDDDKIAIKAIEHCIAQTEGLKLTGTAENAKDGIALIEKHKDIDIAFVDIEMPDMTGFELIKNVITPQVIIVSGKKEYAAEAFDYNVTDFIVKPIDYQRFLKSVERAKEIKDSIKISQRNTDDLFIKKNSKLVKVNANDILYIEALADYVNVFTTKDRFTILSTMKSIESRLPSNDFVRIHRSFIIRLDKIKEIEDELVVINEKALPISRTYKNDFYAKLNLL